MRIEVKKHEAIKTYYEYVYMKGYRYTKKYLLKLFDVSSAWLDDRISPYVGNIKVNRSYISKKYNQQQKIIGNSTNENVIKVERIYKILSDDTYKADKNDKSMALYNLDEVLDYVLNNSSITRQTINVNLVDLSEKPEEFWINLTVKAIKNDYEYRGFSERQIQERIQSLSKKEITDVFKQLSEDVQNNTYLPESYKGIDIQKVYSRNTIVKKEKIGIDEFGEDIYEITKRGRADTPEVELTPDDVKPYFVNRVIPKGDYSENIYREMFQNGYVKISFYTGKKTWFVRIPDEIEQKSDFVKMGYMAYEDFQKIQNK